VSRSFFLTDKSNSPTVPASVSPGGPVEGLNSGRDFLFWPLVGREVNSMEDEFKQKTARFDLIDLVWDRLSPLDISSHLLNGTMGPIR